MFRRCLALSLLLSLPSMSAAETPAGLMLTQLPPDGSWAEYEMKVNVSFDGKEILTGTGQMTIRSVGRLQEKGEDCRWIEFHTKANMKNLDNEMTQDELIKMLIKEKYFKDGKDPLGNILRGWEKEGDQEAKQVEPGSDEFKGLSEMFLALEDVKKLGKQTIEVLGLGKLECDHEEGTVAPRAEALPGRAKIWRHAKSPFGVVQWKIEIKGKVGNMENESLMELKLVKVGTGAKSALPDRN